MAFNHGRNFSNRLSHATPNGFESVRQHSKSDVASVNVLRCLRFDGEFSPSALKPRMEWNEPRQIQFETVAANTIFINNNDNGAYGERSGANNNASDVL